MSCVRIALGMMSDEVVVFVIFVDGVDFTCLGVAFKEFMTVLRMTTDGMSSSVIVRGRMQVLRAIGEAGSCAVEYQHWQ